MAFLNIAPTGTVLPFAGSTAPEGWALCNGQTILRTTYSALFSVIGITHGSGDGSTTFHLPDLRGRFMRGTDTMGTAAGRDPNKATRTAANTGGNTGDAVGSIQANATAPGGLSVAAGTSAHTHSTGSHTHSMPFGYDGIGFFWNDGVAGASVANDTNILINGTRVTGLRRVDAQTTGQSASSTGTPSASGVAPTGDAETRPINANVNYIIKL